MKKTIGVNFIILFLFWTEIKISKNKDAITKIKCFLKKKYVLVFIFAATADDVEEKEKNKPSVKRNININKICLSTFLHHLAKTPVLSLLKLNIFFKLLIN